MADQSKFLHTWELSADSWLLRFYDFWYPDADMAKVNFCKLFWAVICAPLMGVAWIIFGICVGGAKAVKAVGNWFDSRPIPEGADTTNNKSKRLATAIPKGAAKVADGFSAIVQRIDEFLKRHTKAAGFIGKAFLYLLGVAVLGGAAYGIYLLIHLIIINWSWYWFTFAWVIVGGMLIGAVLGAAIYYFFTNTRSGGSFAEWLVRFLTAIGHFLRAGYYATKYRTCPRVVVKP
jgi:hypothetical protein